MQYSNYIFFDFTVNSTINFNIIDIKLVLANTNYSAQINLFNNELIELLNIVKENINSLNFFTKGLYILFNNENLVIKYKVCKLNNHIDFEIYYYNICQLVINFHSLNPTTIETKPVDDISILFTKFNFL